MTLIFQSLPQTDELLRFIGITELAPARAGPAQYSFKAEFYYAKKDLATGQAHMAYDYAWVNLSYLPMFIPESEWQDRRKVRNSHQKYKKVSRLAGSGFKMMADIRTSYVLRNGVPMRATTFENYWLASHTTPSKRFAYGAMLISEHAIPYVLSTSELCRFYIGAFGLIFFELVAALNETGEMTGVRALEGLVHLDRCGWDNSDAGTYRIAPKHGLLDRASALQLAVLLTDEALFKAVSFMVRALKYQVGYGKDGALLSILPGDNSPTLAIECGEAVKNVFGAPGVDAVIPVRKIRWDERPFKFKRLVIDLGNRNPLSDYDVDVETGSGRRTYPVFRNDIKVTEILPNNGAKRKIGDLGPSFSDCFPAARNVTFRIETTTDRPRRRARSARRNRDHISGDTATLNDVSSDVGIPKYANSESSPVGNVSHSVPPDFERIPFFPASPPAGVVHVERYPRQMLDPRMQVFCQARALLIQEGVAQPIFGDESSEAEPVVVPPASWGPFAVNRKYGPRRIGVMCIPTVDLIYYAFELGRRHANEFVSMAVMARIDGRSLDKDEMFAFIAEACMTKTRIGKISSHLAARSIWPSAHQYSDINVDTIIHHSRLYRPTALRQAILSTISAMEYQRHAQAVGAM